MSRVGRPAPIPLLLFASIILVGCITASADFPPPPACFDDALEAVREAERGADLTGVEFSLEANVSEVEVQPVREGIAMAQAFAVHCFGGDVPVEARSPTRVQVVATGAGDPAAGGAAAWASLNQNGPGASMFFDVAGWANATPPGPWTPAAESRKTAAHEYGHVWAHAAGCAPWSVPEVPAWFHEGIAEFVGYGALAAAGGMDRKDVFPFMRQAAANTGQAAAGLSGLATPPIPTWPGHLGFLAVEELVAHAPEGPLALRAYCEGLQTASDAAAAFESAFGVSQETFQEEFHLRRP